MKVLRDYQLEAITRIRNEFANGVQSTLVVIPTGGGKTVLFAHLANEWENGRVLVLAHRIELIDQAADKIGAELGYSPGIEQGMRGYHDDGFYEPAAVIVGSIQTLRNSKRLGKFGSFGLVIIDEAHHCTAASYRKIIGECKEANPDCRFLGVTATPKRSDDSALGQVFDSVAFTMEIAEAIEKGWLVDIKQEFITIEGIDLSGVHSAKNEVGETDFKRSELEAILSQEENLHGMATPILDRTQKGEQAIIFTAGVSHAHLLASILNRHKEGCAAAVDGVTETDKRNEINRRFHSGDLQYLVNFGIYTEGFDAPRTSRIIMGRPTKSPSLYIQMLGRGTRPLPGVVDGYPTIEERLDRIKNSAKPEMLVMDFVGNSRHKAISAVDALGGNYDADVLERAKEIIKDQGGDVLEELKRAKAEKALLREEEEMMRLERRRNIKGTSQYTASQVDVFGKRRQPISNVSGPSYVGEPCSDGQAKYIMFLSRRANEPWTFDAAKKLSPRQARGVIGKLKAKTGL